MPFGLPFFLGDRRHARSHVSLALNESRFDTTQGIDIDGPVAKSMQLLGGRPPGGADATGESRQTNAPPKKSAAPEPDEDEIPF